MKKHLFLRLGFLSLVLAVMTVFFVTAPASAVSAYSEQNDFIKWVDFNPRAELLTEVYKLDVASYGKEPRYDFVEVLSYIACINGNKFNNKKDFATLNKLKKRVEGGETVAEIAQGSKYYNYYCQAYTAIFKQYIGRYTQDGTESYGLKVYHPIAKGYYVSEGDDFGNNRSYGFKRIHLGHDMFGSVGTPIVAVEGGTVSEIGWNRYGGWRVGVRSFDGQRYYYYAHLRKNKPYAEGLEKGATVSAGQVVGYLGCTGYSVKENVNMSAKPHLHFGLQLIFDPSQEDGNGEIWIDVYQLSRFLNSSRARVERQENGHFKSIGLKVPINDSASPDS